MSYSRARSAMGACCSGCAGGMGDVRPIDTTARPGESVYDYMARISAAIGTEIQVAEAGKAFAATQAAAQKAAEAGYPPAQIEQAKAMLTPGGMSSTTKLILFGGAGLALFMLMRRR